jgi:hypothetical protein
MITLTMIAADRRCALKCRGRACDGERSSNFVRSAFCSTWFAADRVPGVRGVDAARVRAGVGPGGRAEESQRCICLGMRMIKVNQGGSRWVDGNAETQRRRGVPACSRCPCVTRRFVSKCVRKVRWGDGPMPDGRARARTGGEFGNVGGDWEGIRVVPGRSGLEVTGLGRLKEELRTGGYGALRSGAIKVNQSKSKWIKVGGRRAIKAGQGWSRLVKGAGESGARLRLRPPSESAAAAALLDAAASTLRARYRGTCRSAPVSKNASAWRRSEGISGDVVGSATEGLQVNPSKSNQRLRGGLGRRKTGQGTRRSASLRCFGWRGVIWWRMAGGFR